MGGPIYRLRLEQSSRLLDGRHALAVRFRSSPPERARGLAHLRSRSRLHLAASRAASCSPLPGGADADAAAAHYYPRPSPRDGLPVRGHAARRHAASVPPRARRWRSGPRSRSCCRCSASRAPSRRSTAPPERTLSKSPRRLRPADALPRARPRHRRGVRHHLDAAEPVLGLPRARGPPAIAMRRSRRPARWSG